MSPDRIESIVRILISFRLIISVICCFSLIKTISDLLEFNAQEYLIKQRMSFGSRQPTLRDKYHLFSESSSAYILFGLLLLVIIASTALIHLTLL